MGETGRARGLATISRRQPYSFNGCSLMHTYGSAVPPYAELLTRPTLTAQERIELETLIDAELDAAVAAHESLLRPPQP